MVAGPLSEALVRGSTGWGGGPVVESGAGWTDGMTGGAVWDGGAARGYGTGFGALIVFTGISVLLGGVSVLGRRVGWV